MLPVLFIALVWNQLSHGQYLYTDSFTCGNITTQSPPTPEKDFPGEVRITSASSDYPYLIPGMSYLVEILSSMEDFQGIHVQNIGSWSKINKTTRCPLTPESLSLPLALIWQSEIAIRTPVHISCAIVYNESYWFNISSVLEPSPDCTQYLTIPYGLITSSVATSNQANRNCNFVIMVEANQSLVIELNFIRLQRAVDGGCVDYIEIIFANQTSGKLCGNSDVKETFNLQSNWAVIYSSYDRNIDYDPFQLFYYTKDLYECNTTLTGTTGTVTSPLYPASAPPNLICATEISLSPDFRVHVQITNLSLPEDDDSSLTIQDGPDFDSCDVCAKRIDLTFDSSSSKVLIRFNTGSMLTNSSFRLDYYGVQVCKNRTLNSHTGTVTSTNYPSNYVNSENCVYTINSLSAIYLYFTDLYTQSADDLRNTGSLCKKDFVEVILDGRAKRFCGNWRRHLQFLKFRARRTIQVIFFSDNATTKPGFAFSWQPFNDDITKCDQALLTRDNSCFEIVYEKKTWLESEKDCQAKGGHLATIINSKIQNIINQEIIESNCSSKDDSFWIGANDKQYESNFYWTKGLKVNYTDWFTGWSMNSLVGVQPSDDGFSNEDCVELRRSFFDAEKGYNQADRYMWNDRDCRVENFYICQCSIAGPAISDTTSPTCDQNIHLKDANSTVIISSPGFPGNYTDFLDCKIIITASPTFHLDVQFTDFFVEPSLGCMYDSLTMSVVPFDLQDETTLILCGDRPTYFYQRWSSNLLYIRFQSDNSRTYTGFRMTISTLKATNRRCNAEWLPKYLGTMIVHPRPLVRAEAEKKCKTQSGQLVLPKTNEDLFLTASQFMNEVSDDVSDSVVIWIESNSSRQMTAMKWDWDQINNSTSVPRNITMETFPINQSLPFICHFTCPDVSHNNKAVLLPNSNGSIRLPNETDALYPNNLHIKWEIQKKGMRILITILSLHLEYHPRCLYDFFKIQNGDQETRLCGNISQPQHFLSRDDELNLTFNSDDTIQDKGFHFEWNQINIDKCFNNSFGGENGTFESFNFGLPFPDLVNCSLSIQCDVDSYVLLTFTSLNTPTETLNSSCVISLKVRETVICLDNVNMMGQQFVSSGENVKLLYKAKEINATNGFTGYYIVGSKTNEDIRKRQEIKANEEINVFSLNFPFRQEQDLQYTTLLSAPFRYKLSLNMQLKRPLYNNTCTNSSLTIIDVSFGSDHYEQLFSICDFLSSNDAKAIVNNITITSRFHQVEIREVYTKDNNFYQAFSITVQSVFDTDFLNQTKGVANGQLESCDDTMCLNNSTCKTVADGVSSTCSCQKHYTGLLCQVTWCELSPCFQGVCRHTDANFTCDCYHGNWGRLCDLTTQQCSLHVCTGNGQCIGSASDPSCRCDEMFKGDDCSIEIEMKNPQKLLRDILLSEPIWIGLIVILSVLFIFGVFYAIRRKFGKYFKCCEPSVKKKKSDKDKKIEMTETNLSGYSNEAYSVEKSLQKFANIPPILITPYTPEPEIDHGRKIASRFFASYNNAEKSPITTPVATDFSQDTATFLVDESSESKKSDMIGGCLSLDHLKVKTGSQLARKTTSLETPSTSTMPRDTRMKRSHSTGPFLVRQETQFDDFALNQKTDMENEAQCSSTEHLYPHVIVAQEGVQSTNSIEGGSPKRTRNNSCETQPSPSLSTHLSVEDAHTSVSRSVDRHGTRDRKRLKDLHSMSKSLDLLEPRKIDIRDHCSCHRCRRTGSENDYHTCRPPPNWQNDYRSASFDDRMTLCQPRCDCKRDSVDSCCGNNERRNRRDCDRHSNNFHGSCHSCEYVKRGSSTESEKYKKYKNFGHKKSSRHGLRRTTRRQRSNEERENDMFLELARLDILRKFLNQDLTDFIMDEETSQVGKNLHPCLRSSSSDPVKTSTHKPVKRKSNSENVSVANAAKVVSPTPFINSTDSDSAMSSAPKSLSPSPHPLEKRTLERSRSRFGSDSAYQTQQQSEEQYVHEFTGCFEENRRKVNLPNRFEDKRVTQRLHQAAIKLFVLQQRHRFLRDSAVHTISEDDYCHGLGEYLDRSNLQSGDHLKTPEFISNTTRGTQPPVTPSGSFDPGTEGDNEEVEV